MSTRMVTLKVLRPRGQRPEVFHDSRWDSGDHEYSGSFTFTVYSYEIGKGNVLRIFGHRAHKPRYSLHWQASESAPFEVALFRPNQWDSVRQD